MLNEETELFCRNRVAEKAAEAENVSLVVVEPSYFTGKTDFAAQTKVTKKENTGEQNAVALKNLLCDFVMTSFVRFDQTKKGAGHCPVVVVTYEFLVFQEFRAGLENETNAHNRHVATVLRIWANFLRGQTLQTAPALIKHGDVEQIGRTEKNRATEFLPNVKGFYSILQTKVEVS